MDNTQCKSRGLDSYIYKPGNDDGCEHGEVVAILNNVSVSIEKVTLLVI